MRRIVSFIVPALLFAGVAATIYFDISDAIDRQEATLDAAK